MHTERLFGEGVSKYVNKKTASTELSGIQACILAYEFATFLSAIERDRPWYTDSSKVFYVERYRPTKARLFRSSA